MLQEWTQVSAPLALGLLGSEGHCLQPQVRLYAIESLRKASALELKMFLLQLVQALKYENAHKMQQAQSASALLQESCRDDLPSSIIPSEMSRTINQIEPLAAFLLNLSITYPELSSYLYWYIKVEKEYSDSINDKGWVSFYVGNEAKPNKQKIQISN